MLPCSQLTEDDHYMTLLGGMGVGSILLACAKLVNWACAYLQNPHITGVWLPIYLQNSSVPSLEKESLREEQGIPSIRGKRDRRRTKKVHINSDPQFLGTLEFLSSCSLGLTPKCALLCLLHLVKSLLLATLCPLCLSSLNISSPRKPFVGDPRTEPRTYTMQPSKHW